MFHRMFGKNHLDDEFLHDVVDACKNWFTEEGCFGTTSQITGGGAIAAAEDMFSVRHNGRPALLTPSATYGMYSVLKALGIHEGSRVCCPVLDWPATYAAVKELGAQPILVPVDKETLTIDPEALKAIELEKVSAVIVSHIHGVVGDVEKIRKVVGTDMPIIEDCAQSLFSMLDGKCAGTFGDAAVFSFGPNKTIDIGEGGMVLTKDFELYEKVLRETAHAERQQISGVGSEINFANFSIRPHPVTAIMLVNDLDAFDIDGNQAQFDRRVRELSDYKGIRLIGADERRKNAASKIPVVWEEDADKRPLMYECVPSGAFDLEKMEPTTREIYLLGDYSTMDAFFAKREAFKNL